MGIHADIRLFASFVRLCSLGRQAPARLGGNLSIPRKARAYGKAMHPPFSYGPKPIAKGSPFSAPHKANTLVYFFGTENFWWPYSYM